MNAAEKLPGRFYPTADDFAAFGERSASDLRAIANERMPGDVRERLLDIANALDAVGIDKLGDVGRDWHAPSLPEQWTPEKGVAAMEDVLTAAARLEHTISRVIMLNASAPYDPERESHIKLNLREIRKTMRRVLTAWSHAVDGSYRGFIRR